MSAYEEWKQAKRPNYEVNRDLKYPYSELPFLGQHRLMKFPIEGKISHVDYWGEGRIENSGKYSGFPAAYNVNRQYQLVSNGADTRRKIPNRIPVRDEKECDTRAYIKDDSVDLVTLMEAPIIPTSAKDIMRMVNTKDGIVVIYSKPAESNEIKLLANELKNKLIVHCPTYELSDYLKEPTLASSHVVFVNEGMIKDMLFKYVTSEDYDKAVTLSKSLESNEVDVIIADVVDRLIEAKSPNVFGYADKLWNAGHHDIVDKHFDLEIKLIAKQEKIKIIGKHFNQALKLDANIDSYNDRLAWGDYGDKSSVRVSWKLIPVWEGNTLLFKVMNLEHSMYIKLDVNVDKWGYGDRQAWGSNNSNEKRHLWKLTPVKVDKDLLVLFENHEYGQGWKLDSLPDSYGDRLLWGNNGTVIGATEYYGFRIQPWN